MRGSAVDLSWILPFLAAQTLRPFASLRVCFFPSDGFHSCSFPSTPISKFNTVAVCTDDLCPHPPVSFPTALSLIFSVFCHKGLLLPNVHLARDDSTDQNLLFVDFGGEKRERGRMKRIKRGKEEEKTTPPYTITSPFPLLVGFCHKRILPETQRRSFCKRTVL